MSTQILPPVPSRQRPVFRWSVPCRLCVGPIAGAGFFLSWGHGAGPFAANAFSGFELVAFAGRLQQLDLTPAEGGALLAVRALVLGVIIAAAWQTLLAPAHRWHFGYVLSGWYLVGVAALGAAIGIARTGLVIPPPGLLLLIVAGLLFAFSSREAPSPPGPLSHSVGEGEQGRL